MEFTCIRITCTLAAIAVGTPMILASPPPGANLSPSDNYFRLPAIVRDFRSVHPDFDVDGRHGLVVNNVAPMLDRVQRLMYTGHGFELASDFTDLSGSDPISLQVYQYGGGTVRLATLPIVNGGGRSRIDSYLPFNGPYGGHNIGPAVALEVGAPMPELLLPAERPPITPDVGHDTSTTISEDIFTNAFMVAGDATVWIDGHVTIICVDAFEVIEGGGIELLPDSTLEVYVTANHPKRFRFTDDARINLASGDHSRVTFYNLGDEDVRFEGQASGYMTLVSPRGTLRLRDEAEFHGVLIAETLRLQHQAQFHHVNPGLCTPATGDTPGAVVGRSSGAITSSETFEHWFRDVLRVNLSAVSEVMFRQSSPTTWTFESQEYYPIDGFLYGNEGDAHNQFFTTELSAMFTYDKCTSQYVTLECSDDAWMTIDGHVVTDLGGLGQKEQILDMDRLGLEDGRDYSLRIFTAQRRRNVSSLEITTNIKLDKGGLPVVSVSAD